MKEKNLFQVLEERRSVRKFNSTKIDKDNSKKNYYRPLIEIL